VPNNQWPLQPESTVVIFGEKMKYYVGSVCLRSMWPKELSSCTQGFIVDLCATHTDLWQRTEQSEEWGDSDEDEVVQDAKDDTPISSSAEDPACDSPSASSERDSGHGAEVSRTCLLSFSTNRSDIKCDHCNWPAEPGGRKTNGDLPSKALGLHTDVAVVHDWTASRR
jgi:hypothetical protein